MKNSLLLTPALPLRIRYNKATSSSTPHNAQSALPSPPPQSWADQPCASTVSFKPCLKHRLRREMSRRASQETRKRKFDELFFFPQGQRCLQRSCGCRCECHHQEITAFPRVWVDSKDREAVDLHRAVLPAVPGGKKCQHGNVRTGYRAWAGKEIYGMPSSTYLRLGKQEFP